MSEFIIGLTGGVASGKSEVSRHFEALGIVVADADQAARDAVAIGSEGLADVVDMFGAGVLASDGSLDRPAMRRRVFADVIGKKDVRGLLRTLSRGGIVAYSADQDFNYQNAFVPFFGVPAATLTATPDLARRGNAVVLPFWFHRDEIGRAHV